MRERAVTGTMDFDVALDFLRQRHQGVLTTLRADGRPQLSNIVYALDAGGVARISVTDGRAKTRNLRRDRRGSLYVPGDSFWSYVVADGTATLTPVAAAPDDPVTDELADLYRAVGGEHPDWEEFRSVMVDEQRLVVRLRLERAYGILPS